MEFPLGNGGFCLLDLPALIVSSHVLSNLSAAELKALRVVSKAAKAVVNGEVHHARISGSDIASGPQPLTLSHAASEFPDVVVLQVSDTAKNHITGSLLSDFLVVPTSNGNSGCAAPGAAIRDLDVKRCHFLTPMDMQRLVGAFPQLQKLSTSRWADGAHLRTLHPLSSHLTELDLGDSTQSITSITDNSLALLPALPVLQSLSLRRCISITDAGISRLASSRLPRLTHLDLSHTRVTGTSGFSTLRLSSLVLRNCRAFGTAGLAAVCDSQGSTLRAIQVYDTAVHPGGSSLWPLSYVPGLEKLDLGPGWEVDMEGLAALACCKALKDLRLGNFNLRPPSLSLSPPTHGSVGVGSPSYGSGLLLSLFADPLGGPLGFGGGGGPSAATAAVAAALWSLWPSSPASLTSPQALLPANVRQTYMPSQSSSSPSSSSSASSSSASFSPSSPSQSSLPPPLLLLPSLTHLSLGGMFSQRGLARLLPSLGGGGGGGRLRSLELSGLSTARDDVLAVLLRSGAGAGLEELRLSSTGPDLTPAGLLSLAQLPSLQRLTLTSCGAATESTVRQLTGAVQAAGRRLHARVLLGKAGGGEA